MALAEASKNDLVTPTNCKQRISCQPPRPTWRQRPSALKRRAAEPCTREGEVGRAGVATKRRVTFAIDDLPHRQAPKPEKGLGVKCAASSEGRLHVEDDDPFGVSEVDAAFAMSEPFHYDSETSSAAQRGEAKLRSARRRLAVVESAQHMCQTYLAKSRAKSVCQFCRRKLDSASDRAKLEASVEKLLARIHPLLKDRRCKAATALAHQEKELAMVSPEERRAQDQVLVAAWDVAMSESALSLYNNFRSSSQRAVRCEFCCRPLCKDQRDVFNVSLQSLVGKIPPVLQSCQKRLAEARGQLAHVRAGAHASGPSEKAVPVAPLEPAASDAVLNVLRRKREARERQEELTSARDEAKQERRKRLELEAVCEELSQAAACANRREAENRLEFQAVFQELSQAADHANRREAQEMRLNSELQAEAAKADVQLTELRDRCETLEASEQHLAHRCENQAALCGDAARKHELAVSKLEHLATARAGDLRVRGELQQRLREALGEVERTVRCDEQFAAEREGILRKADSTNKGLVDELAAERAARSKLEIEVERLRERAAKAVARERDAQAALESATHRNVGELQRRAEAHAEAQVASAIVRRASEWFVQMRPLVAKLCDAGEVSSAEVVACNHSCRQSGFGDVLVTPIDGMAPESVAVVAATKADFADVQIQRPLPGGQRSLDHRCSVGRKLLQDMEPYVRAKSTSVEVDGATAVACRQGFVTNSRKVEAEVETILDSAPSSPASVVASLDDFDCRMFDIAITA